MTDRTLPECLHDWAEDRRRPLVLLVGILLLLLAGCASEPAKTSLFQACIFGKWESLDQIKAVCGKHESEACTINGQFIVTRHPVDWNDTRALFALGHEVAHVLKLNLGGHQ